MYIMRRTVKRPSYSAYVSVTIAGQVLGHGSTQTVRSCSQISPPSERKGGVEKLEFSRFFGTRNDDRALKTTKNTIRFVRYFSSGNINVAFS